MTSKHYYPYEGPYVTACEHSLYWIRSQQGEVDQRKATVKLWNVTCSECLLAISDEIRRRLRHVRGHRRMRAAVRGRKAMHALGNLVIPK